MWLLRGRRLPATAASVTIALTAYAIVAADCAFPVAARPVTRPAPAPGPAVTDIAALASLAPTPSADLPTSIPDTVAWPDATESAVTYAGAAQVTMHGAQRAVPIASIAKVMTAYVILMDHPLAAGAEGPPIAVTAEDAAQYAADAADGQSVTRVEAGEVLTERQALEVLLLRSANNVATLLAAWDTGSVSSFVGRMNEAAARLGLGHTWYADPAGMRQETVSTAVDQVRLGLAALGTPGFAELADLSTASVPVVGTIYNSDTMLGVDGIVGVKSGYTRKAGGTMLVAARTGLHGRTLLVVGALLGESGGFDIVQGNTLDAADRLIVGAERALGG